MSLYLGNDLISGKTTVIGESRNVGQIIPSTIPLSDAGLHLLDGSLILGGGIYSDFVDYIATLYNADPNASYFAQPQGIVESAFTQPALSANGTMGGNSFAVEASSEYTTSTQAWKAFDNDITSGNAWESSTGTPWLTFYNPQALRVTNLQFRNYYANTSAANTPNTVTVQGSNDNSNWTTLTTFNNTNYTANDTWSVSMTGNSSYYKYYRMNFTCTGTYMFVTECVITASYISSTGQTPEEWWQEYVAQYGVCGKFVYDSTNNTVRLPKYNSKIYTGGGTAPAKGNGMTLGLTDGTLNAGAVGVSGSASRISATSDLYGTNIGTTSSQGFGLTNTTSVGITTDSTKSGIIADLANITTALDGYWYIVVATSTKTEIEVDIDEIATDLNGKADVDLTNVSNTSGFRKLVEIYNNGTDWYKVYNEYNPSTGVYIGQWCEQGGETINVTSVSFLKPFTNANWSFTTGAVSTSSSGYGYDYIKNKTASGFDWSAKSANITQIWRTCGYIS